MTILELINNGDKIRELATNKTFFKNTSNEIRYSHLDIENNIKILDSIVLEDDLILITNTEFDTSQWGYT